MPGKNQKRMTARPHDAVLCDIDGVVRHWPSAEDLELTYGLPAGSIAAAHFMPSRLNPAITGRQDLARHELSTLAHVVVSSARIGVAKPDPSFYTIAAEQVGASVDRCLFIDDTPANVAAARGLGMTAVQYQRPEDLRAALAPYL